MLFPLAQTSSLVFAILLTMQSHVPAQLSPIQTVQAAFGAATLRDWRGLADLVHPDALGSLRQESLGLMILMTEERQAGQQASGGYNPGEVVIEEHLGRVGHESASQFTHNPTLAELAALSPADFFVRWCEAVYGPGPQRNEVREVVGLERRMIGEVTEADSLAHVLYRRESRHVDMGELKIDLPGRVMVMPLKRVGGRWLLLFNDDLGWPVDFMGALRPYPDLALRQPGRRSVVNAPQVSPNPVPSATRPPPTEIVEGAFAAFARQDWDRLASLVHTERLASFQREQVAYIIAWTQSKEARARAKRENVGVFMLSYDDTLSPEVVSEVADVKVTTFPGAPTIGELAHLVPTAFFARWCQAAYGKDSTHGWVAAASGDRREVIGQVFEDDTLAHVLYGSDRRYTRPWPVGRMPLKYSPVGWRLLLNHDIGWGLHLEALPEK